MAKGSLLHWGPITALSIIGTLFIGSIYSSLLWWPPDDLSGVLNIALLLVFLLCIVYNFVKAAWVGPGYVLHQWKPVNDEEKKLMQFCQVCDVHKAPRSHHCRQCNRCVLKMDHHCPWINNCVGHRNHKRFTLFLSFVVIGCSYAAYSLIGCIYTIIYAKINIFKESLTKAYSQHMEELLRNLIQVNPHVFRVMEERFVSFGFYHLFGIIFCVGLDLGVILAVGILLYYQACDIIRNESSIEGWIVEKSNYRSKNDGKFIYPYDLGRWENIKQLKLPDMANCEARNKRKLICIASFDVISAMWRIGEPRQSVYFHLRRKDTLKLPKVIHFSGDFIGDGITWPVVEGCNQYTLTAEQLRQKQFKKHYAVEYSVVEDFNGSFCGLRQGCRVCICFPWSLERRLKFKKGDHVLVTRWRKHWLYGAKMQESDDEVKDPEKGWFPRICVVRDDDNMESNKKSQDEKTKHE